GLYEVSVKPADNLAELLAAQRLIDITPVADNILLNGQQVRIIHSPFDSGGAIQVFDKDPDTVGRVLEANPFIFDLYPTIPLDTHSASVPTGRRPDFTITISLYAPGSDIPKTYQQTYKGLPNDALVVIPFDDGPAQSARIYIE